MRVINIQEAKTHLSRLVEDVVKGDDIVISKAGKPLVRLVSYSTRTEPRVGGFCRGEVWEAPDCWDSSDDLLEASIQGPLYTADPSLHEEGLRVAED